MLRMCVAVSLLISSLISINGALGFEVKGQDCSKCHKLSNDEATELLKDMIPNLKILEISPSPAKGFWEVYLESGGRKGLIYVDFPKKHFIAGNLISIAGRKNLTQERLTELNKVNISQIPLEDALVMGDPKAKIRIIAFGDPD